MKKKEKKPVMGLDETFTDKIASATPEEIKAEMIQTQKGLEEAREFKKTDPGFIDAQNDWKNTLGPVNDGIKAGNNRLRFMIERLKEMGAL